MPPPVTASLALPATGTLRSLLDQWVGSRRAEGADTPRPLDAGAMGRVALVGAGPGDPELLTLRAARLIGQADTLVVDHLVSDGVLQFARRGAEMIYVGKESGHHTLPQEEINRLLVRLAYAPMPERKPAPAPRACPPSPPCPRCELAPAPPPELPSPPAPPPEKPCLLPLLSPIHFDTDRDDPLDVKDPLLRSRNIEVLRDVARQIQERPEIRRLRIGGHTDSRGKPAHNKDLSWRRAEHIRRWLTEPGKDRGGIEADRLEAAGFGMERPIAPNASPEGRQRNRRR